MPQLLKLHLHLLLHLLPMPLLLLQLLTLLLHPLLQLHLPLKLRSNPFLMHLSHLRVAFFLGISKKPLSSGCDALNHPPIGAMLLMGNDHVVGGAVEHRAKGLRNQFGCVVFLTQVCRHHGL